VADALFEEEDDANTPLTPEERADLMPSYITLRHELNEAEQINIAAALRWTKARKRDVLDRYFLCELHRQMFGDVWRWAGRYRTTPRNIGVDASDSSSFTRSQTETGVSLASWVICSRCSSESRRSRGEEKVSSTPVTPDRNTSKRSERPTTTLSIRCCSSPVRKLLPQTIIRESIRSVLIRIAQAGPLPRIERE